VVVNSLSHYAATVGGGLEKAHIPIDHHNCGVVEEGGGNTTIFYPYDYLEWDKSSQFISRELQAPVFSFHIHDGDLWMYMLYVNGEIVDQFNPIPDYWDENIDDAEMESWKGDARKIAKYVNAVSPKDIDKYLVRWDLDDEESEKAYPDDEFAQEDWQLLDFMGKLGLPYPLDDDGMPKGDTFKLWTKEFPLKQQPSTATTQVESNANRRPWWKFW
jgi:hypothetical protein